MRDKNLMEIDSTKISKKVQDIKETIKQHDQLVRTFLRAHQVLLLGDKEDYPLLQSIKSKLTEVSPIMLEDIETEILSDSAKMNCIRKFNEGTIIMIDGNNPGTVTETNILKDDESLLNRTFLCIKEDQPTKNYFIYFPRKVYFKDNGDLTTKLLQSIKEEALRQAQLNVEKLLKAQ